MKSKQQFFILASSGKQVVLNTKNTNPLDGIKIDIERFQKKFKKQKYDYLQTTRHVENNLLPRQTILKTIKIKFQNIQQRMYLFYSGHGRQNGDWAVQTTTNPNGDKKEEDITLQDIIKLWKQANKDYPNNKTHLYIIMDSCHSGAWCYRLADIRQTTISIFASCQIYQNCKDINGGLLLSCLFEDQQKFQGNYETLLNFQTPIFIKHSNKVAMMSKEDIFNLNKDIHNTSNIKIKSEDEYTGEYNIHGGKTGKGKMKYQNGNIYEGYWINDRQEGKGQLVYADGVKYVGQFKNNKQQGQGKLYLIDGSVYVGRWLAGNMHGKGKMFYHQKIVKQLEFVNGVLKTE